MTVTFTALVRAMARIVAAMPLPLLVAWLALTATGAAVDVFAMDAALTGLLTLLSSILQLVLTLMVTRRAFAAMAIEREGGAGVFGLLLIGIPLNLGVGLGLLLLVLPGLYLSARWRMAVPRLLATEDGIGEAMRFSWERSAPHWRALMAGSVLIVVPMIAGGALFALAGEEAMPLPAALASNGLLYAGIVAGWLLDLAAYRLIAHSTDDLTRTFA